MVTQPVRLHLSLDASDSDNDTAMRAKSRTLTATRDSLLPELLSGQIRDKDAKRLAEEMA